jgi:hypothetical protein
MAVEGYAGAESAWCIVVAPKIRDGRSGHFFSFYAYVSGFLHPVSSPFHKRQVKMPRIALQLMQEPKQLPKDVVQNQMKCLEIPGIRGHIF